MAKSKFDDGTIVKMIQTHDANFDLSVAALVKLKDAGISQPVIQAMLATVSGRGEARQARLRRRLVPQRLLLVGRWRICRG